MTMRGLQDGVSVIGRQINEGTKAYKAFYDGIKDKLHVRFIKVKGHSNDKYNDMADMLAKEALGLN